MMKSTLDTFFSVLSGAFLNLGFARLAEWFDPLSNSSSGVYLSESNAALPTIACYVESCAALPTIACYVETDSALSVGY